MASYLVGLCTYSLYVLWREENETPGWTQLKLPGQAPSPRCGHTVTSGGHYVITFALFLFLFLVLLFLYIAFSLLRSNMVFYTAPTLSCNRIIYIKCIIVTILFCGRLSIKD